MKKIIALLLAMLLCLTLFGCGDKDDDDDKKDRKEKTSQQDDKADNDPGAVSEKTKLEELIASDEVQKEFNQKADDREMTIGTENGDTVVITMKLLEDRSAEELKDLAEEFDRNANDEDLQEIADLVKEAGAGDSVKIRAQLVDKDGNKVTEYNTRLNGRKSDTETPFTEVPTTEAPTTEAPTTEAPTTTEPPTTETPSQPDDTPAGLMDLNSFVAFMNMMVQQSASDNEEFSMKFELEGQNNIVMTMQAKADLPEDVLQQMQNTAMDDDELNEAFNMDELKEQLAMLTGVTDVKITLRFLDKDGSLLFEKTVK